MLQRWHTIPVVHFLDIFAELRVLHVPDMHTSFQIADASFCGVRDLSDPADNMCQPLDHCNVSHSSHANNETPSQLNVAQ